MKKSLGLFIIVLTIISEACQQTSSTDIGNTPVYQRYKIEFSQTLDVKAFAHFSENKDSNYKDIKLEGEQKVTVNNHSMAYNDIDEQEDFSYSYSAILGKGVQKVTFVFVRRKGSVFTNSVNSDVIQPIYIPGNLVSITSGESFSWEGNPATEAYEVSAELTKDTGDSYSLYNGVIDNSTQSITFHDVPAGNNYTLTIKRWKEISTQEDDLPAKGKFEVYYYDIKNNIQVK